METIVKKDIASAIAQRLGEDEGRVSAFLDTAIEVIKDELIRGRQVTLKDFASIRITEEKAQIIKDPVTGRQLVQPVRKVISFVPSKVFRDRIDQTKLSAIILAVPRDSSFVKVVEYYFARVGWKVHMMHEPAAVLEAVRESGAFLLLVDLSLPGADELVRSMKCDMKTNTIPIVALCPRGMDPEKPRGLRVMGDEALVDPFDIQDLLRASESLLARASENHAFFAQQLTFFFSTEEEFLGKSDELGAALFHGSGLDEQSQVALGAAFREAVSNAAQHGNRDIPTKMIRVDYYLDAQRVTVVVSDEGKGFNHAYYTQRGEGGSALTAARERHRQGRVGGLGIMLMLRCTDRLHYNDVGNSVTLTRHL